MRKAAEQARLYKARLVLMDFSVGQKKARNG
jgi:hypothetical protein